MRLTRFETLDKSYWLVYIISIFDDNFLECLEGASSSSYVPRSMILRRCSRQKLLFVATRFNPTGRIFDSGSTLNSLGLAVCLRCLLSWCVSDLSAVGPRPSRFARRSREQKRERGHQKKICGSEEKRNDQASKRQKVSKLEHHHLTTPPKICFPDSCTELMAVFRQTFAALITLVALGICSVSSFTTTSVVLRRTEPRHTPLYASSSEHPLCDLQTFLRLVDVVPTGGMAKTVIQAGDCRLNGQVETRRAKKLFEGDIVQFHGKDFNVAQQVEKQGYIYKPKTKKLKPQPKVIDGELEFGGRFRSEEWRKERKEKKAQRKSQNDASRKDIELEE